MKKYMQFLSRNANQVIEKLLQVINRVINIDFCCLLYSVKRTDKKAAGHHGPAVSIASYIYILFKFESFDACCVAETTRVIFFFEITLYHAFRRRCMEKTSVAGIYAHMIDFAVLDVSEKYEVAGA